MQKHMLSCLDIDTAILTLARGINLPTPIGMCCRKCYTKNTSIVRNRESNLCLKKIAWGMLSGIYVILLLYNIII